MPTRQICPREPEPLLHSSACRRRSHLDSSRGQGCRRHRQGLAERRAADRARRPRRRQCDSEGRSRYRCRRYQGNAGRRKSSLTHRAGCGQRHRERCPGRGCRNSRWGAAAGQRHSRRIEAAPGHQTAQIRVGQEINQDPRYGLRGCVRFRRHAPGSLFNVLYAPPSATRMPKLPREAYP